LPATSLQGSALTTAGDMFSGEAKPELLYVYIRDTEDMFFTGLLWRIIKIMCSTLEVQGGIRKKTTCRFNF
jgi:hypothetical protein